MTKISKLQIVCHPAGCSGYLLCQNFMQIGPFAFEFKPKKRKKVVDFMDNVCVVSFKLVKVMYNLNAFQ